MDTRPKRPSGARRWVLPAALAGIVTFSSTGVAAPATALRSIDRPKVTTVTTAQATVLGLRCASGTWTVGGQVVSPDLQYSWVANGRVVAGQASSFYLVRNTDVGKYLVCAVTATVDLGSARRTRVLTATATSTPVQVSQPTEPMVKRTVGPAHLVLPRSRVRTLRRGVPLQLASSVTCTPACEVVVTGSLRIAKRIFRLKSTQVFGTAPRRLVVGIGSTAIAALRKVKQGTASIRITVNGEGRAAGRMSQVLTLRPG